MKKKSRVALDPRLLVGVLLVAGSVAGVYFIVAAADETTELYVAGSDLAPGDRVFARDLEIGSVRLDAAAPRYLAPGAIGPEGLVVARFIGAGELVPASALGNPDGLRVTSVVIPIVGPLATAVGPGSTVDLWAAREPEDGEFAAPVAIVSGATVVRLVATDTIVSSSATTGVEVLIPRARIARVLAAIANQDVLSILPVNLP